MASQVCPFCGALSVFVTQQSFGIPRGLSSRYGSDGYYQTLKCSNAECQMFITAVLQADRIVESWPERVGGKDFPDVPEHIASAANEAHKCQSVGAFRASVAMARSVVEATAKHHEITKGNLQSKIDELAKKSIISQAMKDAAHEIRFAGNEAAHGDLAEEPITPDDAEEVLELMDAILTRVYQEPRQVERVRSRRQARGESGT